MACNANRNMCFFKLYRLLHQWLCSPLTTITSIEARQEAVSVLLQEPELMNEVRDFMSKLPDLERKLCRYSFLILFLIFFFFVGTKLIYLGFLKIKQI